MKKFLTISGKTEGLYKEKGSKFFSYTFPVSSEAEIKNLLETVKNLHPKSRHICFAWILGAQSDKYLAADAGEPPNSAGAPILGQIRSRELTNTLVVVVRYFGGTKLGIPGLINAYKTAAAEALEKAGIVEDFEKARIRLITSYAGLDAVMNFIRQRNVVLLDKSFGEKCELELGVPQDEQGIIIDELKNYPETSLCD